MIERYHGNGRQDRALPARRRRRPSLSVRRALGARPARSTPTCVTGTGQAEFLRRIDYPSPVAHGRLVVLRAAALPARAPTSATSSSRRPIPTPTARWPTAAASSTPTSSQRLLEGPWRLTVRHIGTLEENGLWEADGVEFVNGRLPGRDRGDRRRGRRSSPATGTFPSLAIARGVPTVDVRPGRALALGLPDEPLVPLRRADRYMDYIRYPFDAADGPLDEIAARRRPRRGADRRLEAPASSASRSIPRAVVALIEQVVERSAGVRCTSTPVAPLHDARPSPTSCWSAPSCCGPTPRRSARDDDATLILWAPGRRRSRRCWTLAERAIEAAGLDAEQPARHPAGAAPGLAASRSCAQPSAPTRCSASGRPAGRIGALPRFDALVRPEHRAGSRALEVARVVAARVGRAHQRERAPRRPRASGARPASVWR